MDFPPFLSMIFPLQIEDLPPYFCRWFPDECHSLVRRFPILLDDGFVDLWKCEGLEYSRLIARQQAQRGCLARNHSGFRVQPIPSTFLPTLLASLNQHGALEKPLGSTFHYTETRMKRCCRSWNAAVRRLVSFPKSCNERRRRRDWLDCWDAGSWPIDRCLGKTGRRDSNDLLILRRSNNLSKCKPASFCDSLFSQLLHNWSSPTSPLSTWWLSNMVFFMFWPVFTKPGDGDPWISSSTSDLPGRAAASSAARDWSSGVAGVGASVSAFGSSRWLAGKSYEKWRFIAGFYLSQMVM